MKDGGPAFPSLREIHGPARLDGGMSLRDCFAAKAMQAIISGSMAAHKTLDADATIVTVTASYVVADKMLAERAK